VSWFLSSEQFLDEWHQYAWQEKSFTSEELDQIIELGVNLPIQLATLGDNTSRTKKEKLAIRKNKVSWIDVNSETEWLYQRLTGVVSEMNKVYFGFSLAGFFESLQFTMYKGAGDHYEKHCDRAFNKNCRKLSLVLQLSDPKDYEGGDLLLHTSRNPIVMPKERGTICLFPSFTLHQVTPITKGNRYTLVAWVHGPSFK